MVGYNQDGEYHVFANGIHHWVKIEGARNQTVPIVVLHGGPGGNHYVFENTIGKEIATFATVIYYEQRGCGRSEHPKNKEDYSIEHLTTDLLELIKNLGVPQVSLLGYSFGGQLALEFTLRYPELIHQLFLQNPAVDSKRLMYSQIFGFQQVATGEIKQQINEIINQETLSVDELVNHIWNVVDTKTVDQFLFHNPMYATRMRQMWNEFEHKNTGDMARALSKQKRAVELLVDLNKIEVPTLVMAGLYDRNIGMDLLRDIHLSIHHSKFVVFENSAHFPDLEEPEKYTQAIKNFIR